MKRTYKKKSNLINKTGYTPGYATEKNPVNYIPSENITMANTPYPLKGTPLDENGNPLNNGIIMQPGGAYKFEGASYVEEKPMFAKGGQKSDWISAKISTLVKEGYPQKQAVAIAYSMYENKHSYGGYQLPKYQDAGEKKYDFGNTFQGSNFAKPQFSADPNIPTPEQFSEELKNTTQIKGYEYGLGKDPNYVSPLSEQSLTAGQDFKKRTDEMIKEAGLPQDFGSNIFGETSAKKTTDDSGVKPLDVKKEEPFQFFNPYSGFDIPTAASTLGSSIESGDTLGTIGSGLKLATGLARNVVGGMGQERRKNYITKQGYEKQREAMTGEGGETPMGRFGGYYQEGGMEEGQMLNSQEQGMEQQGGGQEEQIMQQVAQALQQGADPQQIMEQLVQMGMPEEQAMALIQGIMQQMQPSTPQLRRGGMMYYQDGAEYGEVGEEEYGDLINKYPNRRASYSSDQADYAEVPKQSYNAVMEETAKSASIESASEANAPKEGTPSYDKNSARDTWVAKTGMPWSEAKKLGYTSGSAKDNMKLLSELNDPRFKKEYLRKKPLSPAKKQAAKTATKSVYEYFGVDKDDLKKREEAYTKANQIKQAPKTSRFDKAIEYAGNPLQTLGHYSKYGELPASGFSRYEQNNLDQVLDLVNPAGWASHAMNAAKEADQGQWREAGEEALGVLPFLRLLKPAKYIPVPKGLPAGKVKAIEQGAKRLNQAPQKMLKQPYTPNFTMYQDGGDYDTYNEKDFKDSDIVRHSGGNTGLTKSEINSLAKQYKMSPKEFLNIVSYGEPGEGMSSRHELYIEGSDKYLSKNWRDTYNQNKPSTTGVRGALNRGLDYIGVNSIFNEGGYYQDGGEQQVAQQVAQAMQQGMQPQEAMSMLVESGMTEDQAIQMVQAIMQQLQQGGQPQQATPQMKRGGYYQEGGEEKAYEARTALQLNQYGQDLQNHYDNSQGTLLNLPPRSQETPTLKTPPLRVVRRFQRIVEPETEDQKAAKAYEARTALQLNQYGQDLQNHYDKLTPRYQEGGMEPGADPAEAMMQQVSQMLQQGADPQEVLQMLVEAGVPEEQAMQMVQAAMQQMQGGQPQQGTPQMRRGGGYYQEGGEAMDEQMEGEDEGAEGETPSMEQIESQVEEALKQGANPEEILQQLVQMGMPEEQAVQMIQEILQEIQGGETGMEAPEEATPQMSKGGKYMRALVGKTIKNYTYNPKTDSYTVSYE